MTKNDGVCSVLCFFPFRNYITWNLIILNFLISTGFINILFSAFLVYLWLYAIVFISVLPTQAIIKPFTIVCWFWPKMTEVWVKRRECSHLGKKLHMQRKIVVKKLYYAHNTWIRSPDISTECFVIVLRRLKCLKLGGSGRLPQYF